MSGIVETLEWVKPRSHDRDCNVYGCEEPSVAVLRVGGGASESDTSASSLRFCSGHFNALRVRSDMFWRTCV